MFQLFISNTCKRLKTVSLHSTSSRAWDYFTVPWFVVSSKYQIELLYFLSISADYSTSEMLVNMGNLPLDEFYPAVAIVTLMRILRDPSLSNHHTMVVQAVTFIFKSLGLKCVQFLPQVMPTFLNVIRVCDASIREVGCTIWGKRLFGIFFLMNLTRVNKQLYTKQ